MSPKLAPGQNSINDEMRMQRKKSEGQKWRERERLGGEEAS